MSQIRLEAPVIVPRPALADVIETERRRRRRRRAIEVAVFFVIVAGAAAAYFALQPRPVPIAEQYRTELVTRGDVIHEVRASGHVEAVTTVEVGAEISGRLSTVEVEFNQRVRAGQVLARFDDAVLAAQLREARARLDAARASVEQASADLEHATRSRARAQLLRDRGSGTEAELEAALTAERLAAQRLRAAESTLGAHRAALALARINLDHTIVRSPIDGVVITRAVDPGQTVASVLQTPVLFTVAADLARMRVIAAVDEADVGEVRAGQSATFTVPAYPDRKFTGTVTEVRSAPEVLQNVVTYGTVVEVDNRDLLLKPGMTASARIRTADARDALRVPTAALGFTPPGRRVRAGAAVWVLEARRLRRVQVRRIVSDEERTAVVGRLDAGARVLVDLTSEGRRAHGLTH